MIGAGVGVVKATVQTRAQAKTRGAPTETGTGASRQVVGSVLRAMHLLDCFERGHPELTLPELVRRSGYSKTTTYRLLITLEQAGWLDRSPAGAFRLTMKPFRLGSILIESLDLRREAAPVMVKLAVECQESAYLVVPAGTHAVCLERVDAPNAVRLADLNVGGSQPLHLGAGPRVLLAFNEQELLPAVIREGLSVKTEHSISTLAALAADLAETRRRGYSISDEDATLNVAAIGAPVYDASGRVVAALSIGGLRTRILPPRQLHLDLLEQACRDISARLGHRGT